MCFSCLCLCFFFFVDRVQRQEREVMLKLKEVVDKQRDEIRAKAQEISSVSKEVEAVCFVFVFLAVCTHTLPCQHTLLSKHTLLCFCTIKQVRDLLTYLPSSTHQTTGDIYCHLVELSRRKIKVNPLCLCQLALPCLFSALSKQRKCS